MNDIKQVIVVRKDLNMRKGKMIAQGAHASLKVITDRMGVGDWIGSEIIMIPSDSLPHMVAWIQGLCKKVVVGVDSLNELMDIFYKASNNAIPCSLVQGMGLTEFSEPTYTAVAVGPDLDDKIDLVTGGLKLL